MKNDNILVSQKFTCSKERMWKAITDVNEMRQWFFHNIPEFKPEIGFTTWFDVQAETRIFPHVWKILDVLPEQHIVLDWTFTGFDGVSKLTFKIEEISDGVLLSVINEIIEPFDTNIPEFKRESGIEGWNYFIKGRLPEYLNQ